MNPYFVRLASELSSRIAGLQNDILVIAGRLEAQIEAQVEAQMSAEDHLTSRIAGLQKDILVIAGRLVSIELWAPRLEQIEAQIEAQVEAQMSAAARLTSRVAGLHKDITAVAYRLASIEGTLGNLADAETRRQDLAKALDNLHAQFERWAPRLEQIETRVQDLAQGPEALRAQFERWAPRLEQIEALISPAIHQCRHSAQYSPDRASPTFSQSGEDRIIRYLFETYRDQAELNYVDIGAADPTQHNNTYLFYTPNTRGLLVEADPDYMSGYAALRPADTAVNLAVVPERLFGSGQVEFYAMNNPGWSTVSVEHVALAERLNMGGVRKKFTVPCITINQLLSEYSADYEIDLLSVDIEGLDAEVLGEMDTERFRPKAVIAENSPGGQRIHEATMEARGYMTYAYTHVNTIYIDRTCFKL
jgi:FkbM family methyltransferase